MSRLWLTHRYEKVEQYSVWAESATMQSSEGVVASSLNLLFIKPHYLCCLLPTRSGLDDTHTCCCLKCGCSLLFCGRDQVDLVVLVGWGSRPHHPAHMSKSFSILPRILLRSFLIFPFPTHYTLFRLRLNTLKSRLEMVRIVIKGKIFLPIIGVPQALVPDTKLSKICFSVFAFFTEQISCDLS